MEVGDLAEIELKEQPDSIIGKISQLSDQIGLINRQESEANQIIKENEELIIEAVPGSDRPFLPFYSRQTDSGYQIFIRSANGIQRYTFSEYSSLIKLDEKRTGEPIFTEKAVSKPIFEYSSNSKFQAPNLKQIPSTKFQNPNFLETDSESKTKI